MILGSTGSIGTQAVDIVQRNPERFRVVGLAAGGGRADLLAKQAVDLGAERVAVADPARAAELTRLLGEQGAAPEVLVGAQGVAELAASPVTSSSTGSPGRWVWSPPWPRCAPGPLWPWPTRNP